jgi:uncharacterized metal-binding protein (TIGR02443 family)
MYFFKCPNCREPLAAEREDIMASVECVHCAYQMHLTPGVVSENLFQRPKAPGQAPAKAPAKDLVQQDTGSSHRVITLIIVLSIVLGIGYVIDSIQSAPDEDKSRLRMLEIQRMADSIQRAQNEIATTSQRTSMEPIPEANFNIDESLENLELF